MHSAKQTATSNAVHSVYGNCYRLDNAAINPKLNPIKLVSTLTTAEHAKYATIN